MRMSRCALALHLHYLNRTDTCTCASDHTQVEIGAFRCYPDGYKPPHTAPSEYQTIPSDKIEDFGTRLLLQLSLVVSSVSACLPLCIAVRLPTLRLFPFAFNS